MVVVVVGGGVGITSGDNSLCGTKPSGSYDISLQPCSKEKKKKAKKKKKKDRLEYLVKKDSESTQITKLFSLCCHQTGQDVCAAQADADADK